MSSEDKAVEPSIEHAGNVPAKSVSRFTRWYRSPLFNVIIVGLISFTQPGIWNALNSKMSNRIHEYEMLTICRCWSWRTAGTIPCQWRKLIDLWYYGLRLLDLCHPCEQVRSQKCVDLGNFGLCAILRIFVRYVELHRCSELLLTYLVNNRYGTEWFVLVGGATCGLAASALWAAEGAIALGYADVHNRGKFTGIWLGLRELGQLIGSSIQLSLNYKSGQRGKVGYTTYIVLIALQCLGLPLALLSSPPHKVIHPDGRKVSDPTKNKAIMKEVRRWWDLLRDKRFFLLIPVMIGFNWNNTYQGIYLTKYFSVRARTLGSLTSGIAATAANIFWGWFYDTKYFSRPTLAKYTWSIFSVLMLALFGWQVANEKLYGEAIPKVTLDWALPGFGRGFAVNVLFRYA